MIELALSADPQKRDPRYRATLFLDRDGTINVKPPKGQYITAE